MKKNTQKISYIDLINRFWTVQERAGLCVSDIALYFLLLHKFNRMGWASPVEYASCDLTRRGGMSKDTLRRARQRLKEAGLIDFVEGRKGVAMPLYYLPQDAGCAPTDAPKSAPMGAPLYKDYKTEDNNITPKSPFADYGNHQTDNTRHYGTYHPTGYATNAEQARLERERNAADIIARLAAQNRLD